MMRRKKSGGARFDFVMCGILLCGALGLYLVPSITWSIVHRLVPDSRLQYIETSNAQRAQFYLSPGDAPPTRHPAQWQEIQATYQLFHALAKDPSRARALRFHCQERSDLERLRDSECRAEWLHHLATARVVAIENMMGFALGKKGAFEVRFADGRKAMFKPCGSPREWPENEVRASHLDHALGLYRAPPSVMRTLSLESMRKLLGQQVGALSLLDNSAWIMQQLERTCALDGHLQGAMIGWFGELEATQTFPKSLGALDGEAVAEYRRQEAPATLLDVAQNHLFFYLIHSVRRVGYNEYRVHDGPLLTVDLDRANFAPGPSSILPLTRLSVCHMCAIEGPLYEMLLQSLEEDSLLLTLQHSLAHDPLPLVMPTEEGRTIQRRIAKFVELCLGPCIERYGYEQVVRPPLSA